MKKNEHEHDIPLQVTFKNLDVSEAVRFAINEKFDKLKRHNQRITKCEVVVSAPHKSMSKGRYFHVELKVNVPGDVLVVNREPERDAAHENIYLALRDAFLAMDRKMDTFVSKQRGMVKNHSN